MNIIRDEDAPTRELAEGVFLQDKFTNETINIAEVRIEKGEYPIGRYAVNKTCAMTIVGLGGHCSIFIKGQEKMGIGTGDILEIPKGTPYRYEAQKTHLQLISNPPWSQEQYAEVEHE